MAQKERRAAKMVKERARARRVSRRASMEERKVMEKEKDLGVNGKGKGRESRDCWKCSKTGHLAKDCLRQVQEVQVQQSDAPGGPILQRGVRLLPLLLLQVDGMEVAVLQGWLRLHQSTMCFHLCQLSST